MSDNSYDDLFNLIDQDVTSDPQDPINQQTPVTPQPGEMPSTGSQKMLVVIYVIDCSRTMDGERISAVNGAMDQMRYKLSEIQNENGLDLKVAVMSFASSIKWELELTSIAEVVFSKIETRPGLTSYGAAFRELNKVLNKEKFMKHTGKKAPPAIILLTDGEPDDSYQDDLDKLLNNGWFVNANRSAVLVGDAINNPKAKEAVRCFVKDADKDIVSAHNSTIILDCINLATQHTIGGEPIKNDNTDISNKYVNIDTSNNTSEKGTDNLPTDANNNSAEPPIDTTEDPFASFAFDTIIN